MNKLLIGAGVAALAAVSQSAARTADDDQISAETLAMLDPSRGGAALCGGPKGADALRARLRLAAATQASGEELAPPMPLYEGVPPSALQVSTSNERARRYFDQGVMMVYGFNHAGAIRSFREAQRLDPNCALCWWGEALAHGPNINAPMDPATVGEAIAATARAVALRDNASPSERALIDAVALRYSDDAGADRSALDMAYAEAMLAVSARFPDDDDIAVLAAEAVMDTSPWNYWEANRETPVGRIGEAVALIERVMTRNPAHPQAAHLYIHLMENNANPNRAEAAADELTQYIAPSAGHLVHMPAHIYYRIGRYEDSMRVNLAAARADEAYLESAGDNGLYRFGYYPHNVHFIVTSAQLAGDMATAIRESMRLAAVLSPEVAVQFAWVQPVHAAPYLAVAQFADPDRILALPEADARLPYVVAMRHYARAVAQAQRQDREGFDAEIAALREIRETADLEAMVAQGVPGPDLLLLAERVAQGRYAFAERRYDEAVRLYREAIELENALPYTEPPYWYYPVDQSLGAALFAAGRHEEARDAFRAALGKAPFSGWALYGLAATERALGHRVEAAAADAALERAWIGSPRWLRMERL